ncbi:hypothetical protein E4U43_002624 [Claviceps pusilla]|uniref:OTU domain-containing protein n=1 Tax=Claviceps pusilla TaxID=123648 RepID=A0A9P7N8H4_9HYPO|nr:hypothetical protein E4U43_002624 [Claviceps pusilla]
MESVRESLEDMRARHRRELKDLQGRITSKKKNATKKTRRGVNDECAQMERVMRERQAGEVAGLQGHDENDEDEAEQEGGDEDGGDAAVEEHTGTKIGREMAKMDLDGRQEEQQQQQQQQPARKRNRQKDRLARRAAERAAAAEEASAEASTMTDHRGRERTSLKKVFDAHGLVEKEIAPDGHCLFAAVADQLLAEGVVTSFDDEGKTSPDPPYRIVRRAAAEYMAAHGDRFEGFMEDDLETYVARMRDTAEWGGQLELMALAGRYGVEIRVVQDGGRIESIRTGEQEGGQETADETKILWLAYYRFGFGLGEHYNSLRKAG